VIDTAVESNPSNVKSAQGSWPQASPVSGNGSSMAPWIFTTSLQRNVTLITDRGRELPLFRFQAYALPSAGQHVAVATDAERREFFRSAERLFLSNTRQEESKLLRLREPHPVGNCHGWVFTHGCFGIESSEVPAILADNGYAAVEDVRDGDLAIYVKGEEVTHSGIARVVENSGLIVVDSKWGPFSVFRHAVDAHPFEGCCVFYRSRRDGHGVEIRPV
jgi:hypothetical protein